MSTGNRNERIRDAEEMISLYTKAEKAVLSGQAYTIAGQSMTRADLDKIRAGRKEWQETLEKLQGNGGRVFRQVVPRGC